MYNIIRLFPAEWVMNGPAAAAEGDQRNRDACIVSLHACITRV